MPDLRLASLAARAGQDPRPHHAAARADFDQALALHPGFAEAYSNRGASWEREALWLPKGSPEARAAFARANSGTARAGRSAPRRGSRRRPGRAKPTRVRQDPAGPEPRRSHRNPVRPGRRLA